MVERELDWDKLTESLCDLVQITLSEWSTQYGGWMIYMVPMSSKA